MLNYPERLLLGLLLIFSCCWGCAGQRVPPLVCDVHDAGIAASRCPDIAVKLADGGVSAQDGGQRLDQVDQWDCWPALRPDVVMIQYYWHVPVRGCQ